MNEIRYLSKKNKELFFYINFSMKIIQRLTFQPSLIPPRAFLPIVSGVTFNFPIALSISTSFSSKKEKEFQSNALSTLYNHRSNNCGGNTKFFNCSSNFCIGVS